MCFHVTKRKVANHIRIAKPRRASQLSECFGAGTGCGWCRPYLQREVALLGRARVYLALGGIGYAAPAVELGVGARPRSGHGVEVPPDGDRTLVCSYHVSQQNTFTGRLTPAMFDDVLHRGRALGGSNPCGADRCSGGRGTSR